MPAVKISQTGMVLGGPDASELLTPPRLQFTMFADTGATYAVSLASSEQTCQVLADALSSPDGAVVSVSGHLARCPQGIDRIVASSVIVVCDDGLDSV
jgi:hypothetical protein